MVTVDGRQPGESIGMSLTMLADLLIEFGASEAINLDGGGSTTMVIRNTVVNKPSDATGERPVSDAILIYPKRQ
jgi:exopolysaccharide biosynthesis protein